MDISYEDLLKSVLDEPDNIGRRMILADWQDEYGEENEVLHAELIRLQNCVGKRNVDREHELMERLKGTGVIGHFPSQENHPFQMGGGFIEIVQCTSEEWYDEGDKCVSRSPIREVRLLDRPDLGQDKWRRLANRRQQNYEMAKERVQYEFRSIAPEFDCDWTMIRIILRTCWPIVDRWEIPTVEQERFRRNQEEPSSRGFSYREMADALEVSTTSGLLYPSRTETIQSGTMQPPRGTENTAGQIELLPGERYYPDVLLGELSRGGRSPLTPSQIGAINFSGAIEFQMASGVLRPGTIIRDGNGTPIGMVSDGQGVSASSGSIPNVYGPSPMQGIGRLVGTIPLLQEASSRIGGQFVRDEVSQRIIESTQRVLGPNYPIMGYIQTEAGEEQEVPVAISSDTDELRQPLATASVLPPSQIAQNIRAGDFTPYILSSEEVREIEEYYRQQGEYNRQIDRVMDGDPTVAPPQGIIHAEQVEYMTREENLELLEETLQRLNTTLIQETGDSEWRIISNRVLHTAPVSNGDATVNV